MASIDSENPALAQARGTAARRGRPRKAGTRTAGGFIVDKETIYPGLIIFRRADVAHHNWYCRIKLPKAERYKTVALKTADAATARQLAMKQDMKIQARLEDGIPIFDRPFLSVAREYLATQEERADRHRISEGRVEKMRSIIEVVLNGYVGSTQVSKIGQVTWDDYPAWRRANGRGRNVRNGVRAVSPELAATLIAQEKAARQRARVARGLHPTKRAGDEGEREPVIDASSVPFVSDSTIRFEMSIFGAVMNYAIKKKYAPASQRFDDRPKLKVMRRDAFSREEYRHLYETSRDWANGKERDADGSKLPPKAQRSASRWYRTVAHNFMLIMCNTGMRPSEAKNLRWGDITPTTDKHGRDYGVLFVQGKGKSRQLVAPPSVLTYLNRIREIARTQSKTEKDDDGDPKIIVGNPAFDDFVFTTHNGKRAGSLYQALIESMFENAGLRAGSNGIPRSTYCFRHTYATFRLEEGIDVYFLAQQMGTSVKMIEDHYGHATALRHADRVLHNIVGWESLPELAAPTTDTTKAAHTVAAKAKVMPKPKRTKP